MTADGGASDALSVLLCTGGYDHCIRLWEAWSGICSRTIPHADSQVNRLAISPDKRYIAAAGHSHVRIYDTLQTTSHHGHHSHHHSQQQHSNTALQPVLTFSEHTGNVTCVAWHLEAKWIVTGSEDGTLKVWDTRTASLQRNFDHRSPVNDCVVHPNQGELISCDQSGAIKVWDLAQNLCTHELLPEDDVPMRSVTVASDGSCLIGGNNKGNVYVWNMVSQPLTPSSSGESDDPSASSSVTFGAETTLTPRTKFQAHNRYLLKVLLSPDAKLLATCSADTTIKIWSLGEGNTSSHRLEKVLEGHQRWVWDLAFSADSAYLVSASSDHTARLWEIATGQTVRQYTGHQKAAVCVALNDVSA